MKTYSSHHKRALLADSIPPLPRPSREELSNESTPSAAYSDSFESPQIRLPSARSPDDSQSFPSPSFPEEADSLKPSLTRVANSMEGDLPKSHNSNRSASSLPSAGAVSTQNGFVRSARWSCRTFLFLSTRLFQFSCLVVLLAVASSVPILQLASLGYLLDVARRIADNQPNESKLPGLAKAGRLGVVVSSVFLTWLPIWLICDVAYTAHLISPNSTQAMGWTVAAISMTGVWLVHSVWALLRGGRWYHFLWPAPIRFVKQIWRSETWRAGEDALWNYTVNLELWRLGWLGFRAGAAALIWLAVPGVLVVTGMGAHDRPALVLIGLFGAMMMSVVLLYLPYLQVQLAQRNRFRAAFDVRSVRETFKHAPVAFFVSLFVTLLFAIPLYLFRIESLPTEVLWLPCLFFVLFALPARALTGWAMRRGQRDRPRRHWVVRYFAWGLQVACLPPYIGFMYLATLASWDGVLIVFFQHAFLVPVPLAGN